MSDIGLSGGALGVVVVLGLAVGLLHLLDRHLRYAAEGKQRRVQAARWARRRDLRDMRGDGNEPGRLVLGRHGGRLLATIGQSSVVVIGPTRTSFKTTGFTIPAVLEWDGPVVVTSTKSDLLMATIARRRQMGRAMVFDPTGMSGMGNVKATPLSGCGSWGGSLRVAHRLSASARSGGDGLQDSAFWHAAAEKLLAPILFAAASSGGEMADVIRWLNDGADAEPEVRERLEAAGDSEALSAWRANWNREERQRSSIYTTAETILRAFADPLVLDACSRADYTPAAFLDGGANTLYLCGPEHEQERLASLFAAMISELVAVVAEFSAETGKPIEPAVPVVADEAANSAPIPNLAGIASSGAGQGVLLLSVFQDLAQVEDWLGKKARTAINNHHAKVICAGASDPSTLTYVDEVLGQGAFRQHSETASARGQGSTTEGSIFRSLAPANAVREGAPGTAVLICPHRPPAWIELRPWFKDPELSAMVEGRR